MEAPKTQIPKKYLGKNSGKYELNSIPGRLFQMAVVIPAHCESEYLPFTLECLAKNPRHDIEKTMIILVVNNPSRESDKSPDLYADNRKTLENLKAGRFSGQKKLNLFWVDASSPGKEIHRKGGVGAARKIGMDLALKYLDFENENDPLIISLDADTLLENNYLKSISEYFKKNPGISAASINFEHQRSGDPEINSAITDYELFIRYYVWGLRISQSPYAYHALGSAMAVRASAYVRAGGMRVRNGGEDFYFLEAVRKTGAHIGFIADTCVYPSSRASDRVPFGTGPKIASIIKKNEEFKIHNPAIFKLLKEIVANPRLSSMPAAAEWLASLPVECSEYLEIEGLLNDWKNILENTPKNDSKIKWAFHVWFDALKTLKFVHFCEIRYPEKYPKLEIAEAYHLLFKENHLHTKENLPTGKSELLEYVRKWEAGLFNSERYSR